MKRTADAAEKEYLVSKLEMVADEQAEDDDRFRIRATLDGKIVISLGRKTFRAATRARANLLKEKQFDRVFILDLGNPDHPNGILVDP